MKEFTGRFIYHCGYYDGPLNGVMETDDRKQYWFEVAEESVDEYVYWYFLYELTPEEWQYETRRHELFQKYVGEHCDYDADGRRHHGKLKPQSEWHKFYDNVELGGYRVHNGTDYTNRAPVGIWAPYGRGESDGA